MVDMTSNELLKNIIQDGMNQGLDAEEMAGYIVDNGFVHVVTGHVAADIIRWAALEMQSVLHHAEMAEVIALPEGTTGVEEAISAGESVLESPEDWLFNLAEKIRKGESS